MGAKTILQVMICTCGEQGLDRVADMRLPEVVGVEYLISCQSAPRALPAALQRPDVAVHFTPTSGLSPNRNNALSLATAPWLQVADDDLRYTAEGLAALVDACQAHADADILLTRFDLPGHSYPTGECALPRPCKGHSPASVEIALRREAVERLSLRFSPLLGIGAPYLSCGEEDMLVYNARRRGARVVYVPIKPGSHPDTPTLHRGPRPDGALRAAGAVIALQYPWTALLRMPLAAHRLRGPFWHNLGCIIRGALYGLRHRREILNPAK